MHSYPRLLGRWALLVLFRLYFIYLHMLFILSIIFHLWQRYLEWTIGIDALLSFFAVYIKNIACHPSVDLPGLTNPRHWAWYPTQRLGCPSFVAVTNNQGPRLCIITRAEPYLDACATIHFLFVSVEGLSTERNVTWGQEPRYRRLVQRLAPRKCSTPKSYQWDLSRCVVWSTTGVGGGSGTEACVTKRVCVYVCVCGGGVSRGGGR